MKIMLEGRLIKVWLEERRYGWYLEKAVENRGEGGRGDVWGEGSLKYPSQPPPFSMPSKLLILHSEEKRYWFSESCVPGRVFDYLL